MISLPAPMLPAAQKMLTALAPALAATGTPDAVLAVKKHQQKAVRDTSAPPSATQQCPTNDPCRSQEAEIAKVLARRGDITKRLEAAAEKNLPGGPDSQSQMELEKIRKEHTASLAEEQRARDALGRSRKKAQAK
jgi:hypothetical protein